MREITDEEIEEVAEEFSENMEGYSYYRPSFGIPEDKYIDFGRALFRKAQETCDN